jgi:hypothetical protein
MRPILFFSPEGCQANLCPVAGGPNPPSKKENHRAHREFLWDLKKIQQVTRCKFFTKRVHGV